VNEIITEALKYLEKKRIIYNIGLAIIVVVVFAIESPAAFEKFNILFVFQIFMLAVLANVAFSTA